MTGHEDPEMRGAWVMVGQLTEAVERIVALFRKEHKQSDYTLTD